MSQFLGQRNFVTVRFIDINLESSNKNGLVKVSKVYDNPILEFPAEGLPKIRFTISVPSDYVVGTDIIVKIFWSTDGYNSGLVEWDVKFRALKSGIDSINNIYTTYNCTQSTTVPNLLIDTGDNLVISGVSDINYIMTFVIERKNDITNLYNGIVRVHMIRLEYKIK